MFHVGKVKNVVAELFGPGASYARDDLVMDLGPGEGLRLGTRSDNGFGWRDLEGAIDVKGVGVNDPDWAEVNSTGFFNYKFVVNDVCFFDYHIPHDWWPNASGFYIHAHWFTDGTSTNTVKWSWSLAYAAGYNTEAFPLGAPAVVSVEEAASGVVYQHMISEVYVPISDIEVDGMVKSVLTRVTNGGVDNADNVFLSTSDIHYQSTNMPTKNRNPDFYT